MDICGLRFAPKVNCPLHDVSVEEIAKQYEPERKRWRNSYLTKCLIETFEQQIIPFAPHVQITNAMCCGLGSLTCPSIGANDDTHETLEQLAAFESFVDFLSKFSRQIPVH